jgi:peptidoglycan/LPS O-acetylase OafA/YrhL
LSENRVHFFDGLRGWAAIIVVLHHNVITFPELDFLLHTPLRPFVDGLFAVYIFFVLSGIVLSMGYICRRDMSLLTSLAIKRIPRLSIPILSSCLIIVLLMKLGFFYNAEAAILTGDNSSWLGGFYSFDGDYIEAIKFSIRDVFFNYETASSYSVSLWTMTWELFGSYLVVIVLLCSKYITASNRGANIFWAAVLLYLWIYSVPLFSFMLGVVISHIYVKEPHFLEKIRKSLMLKMLLILLTICAYLGSGLFSMLKIEHLQETMYSVTAFLLVLIIIVSPMLQRVFSVKLSRFLGKISFPLYIVHIPILCTLTSYLVVCGYSADNNNFMAIFIISILASIIIACIFYPIEKLSIKVSGKISDAVIGGGGRA